MCKLEIFQIQHFLFNTKVQGLLGSHKGKLIAETTPPITFMFTPYCLFSTVYRFMSMIENVEENVGLHRGHSCEQIQ